MKTHVDNSVWSARDQNKERDRHVATKTLERAAEFSDRMAEADTRDPDSSRLLRAGRDHRPR